MEKKIIILETFRDAIQSNKKIIDVGSKKEIILNYIEKVLRVGFPMVDIGSFVSYKAVPQMAYTPEILEYLENQPDKFWNSKIVVLVANSEKAQEALCYNTVNIIAYPFSISPTFLMKNLRIDLEKAINEVKTIDIICKEKKVKLIIYISMAFGNPYGDEYSIKILMKEIEKILNIDEDIDISLADTTSEATPKLINMVFLEACKNFPKINFGIHIHTDPLTWKDKVNAALEAGCQWFDAALGGYGGCPFTGKELIGNLPTELLISYLKELNLLGPLNLDLIDECLYIARKQLFN